MGNVMAIKNQEALIVFDSELEMFRGEFVNLNGSADFYALSVQELHREGEVSLNTFLDVCQEQGIEPYKHHSGKLVERGSLEHEAMEETSYLLQNSRNAQRLLESIAQLEKKA